MSRVLSAVHGNFGRVYVYDFTRGVAKHVHREAQLVFNISGCPTPMCVGGKKMLATSQQAVVINPVQPHRLLPVDSRQRMMNLTLQIDPTWFSRVKGDVASKLKFGSNVLSLSEGTTEQINTIFNLLRRNDNLDHLEQLLFDLTNTCYSQSWSQSPLIAESQKIADNTIDRRVNHAIGLMHKITRSQMENNCALADIARESGLSRPHFFKLFQSNTGVTPKLYMNTLRVERAIDKLTRTAQPVTDIGMDLGFASQPSFSRFFFANVGSSPSDYRRAASLMG